ncbi:MAG: prolipoprotein diacylglyceryl transferase, partial [Lactobacillus iners]|nr:prolipoprotein diacylglyceryl transferase [Lactobacillus iners]
PLWPAEIWESQCDVLLFVILLFYSSFPHKRGQVFCLYVFLYCIERFFLEFLRGDYFTIVSGLKSAQLTALIAGIIAIIIFFILQYKGMPSFQNK